MISVRKLQLVLAAALICGLAACGSQSKQPVPLLLEDPSTNFLKREIADAISEIEQGQRDLTGAPEEARRSLAVARDRLSHISSYSLPLMEARERAYNAYYLCARRDAARTEREIDAIESLLTSVVRSEGEHIAPEIEEMLETLADARLALDTRPDEAVKQIARVATHLTGMVFKGRLVNPPPGSGG